MISIQTRDFLTKINSTLRGYLFLITPMMIGLFPVLSFYERNIQDVPSSLIWKPIIVVILVTIIGGLLLLTVVKKKNKVGIILSISWLFFFMYVPLVNFAIEFLAVVKDLDSYFLPLWLLFLGFVIVYILKSKHQYKTQLNFMTFMGLTVIGLQVFGIVNHTVGVSETEYYKYLVDPINISKQGSETEKSPDIYYILLDAYPRSDTLEEYFGFNNSEFDNFLTSKDFYLARGSFSNYNQTALAMPAILNMSYIKDLPARGGIPLTELTELYHNNKTLHFLKEKGYKWINNTNYYRAGANPYADLNIHCDKSNEFLKELINVTILKPFKLVADQQRNNLRQDANCVLSHIDTELAGPQFTFTHLLSPHPPYIFDEHGNDVSEVNLSLNDATRWLAKEPFLEQMQYINKKISEEIIQILEQSQDPIIVVQSDHGSLSSATEGNNIADARPIVLRERSRNYLAIHLPEYCDRSQLKANITGVNTFRIIINSCFGADYNLLEDNIYYDNSGPAGYSHFEDITNIVNN